MLEGIIAGIMRIKYFYNQFSGVLIYQKKGVMVWVAWRFLFYFTILLSLCVTIACVGYGVEPGLV